MRTGSSRSIVFWVAAGLIALWFILPHYFKCTAPKEKLKKDRGRVQNLPTESDYEFEKELKENEHDGHYFEPSAAFKE
jgi:hypothetical protein